MSICSCWNSAAWAPRLAEIAPTKARAGSFEPLADDPAVQVELARAEGGLQAARAFVFDERGFHWRDAAATADEVAAARHKAGGSFGSCSFDEPRDDLRALGLLS